MSRATKKVAVTVTMYGKRANLSGFDVHDPGQYSICQGREGFLVCIPSLANQQNKGYQKSVIISL